MTSAGPRPIGVFDSGVGGLTVFKALETAFPGESLIYLGDTARVPYGTRSADTVVRYSLEAARFMREHKIKLLVVACNTASAVALEPVASEVGAPVVEYARKRNWWTALCVIHIRSCVGLPSKSAATGSCGSPSGKKLP